MNGRGRLLLCLFLLVALTTPRQLTVAAAGSKVVTSLPGFQGRLPFQFVHICARQLQVHSSSSQSPTTAPYRACKSTPTHGPRWQMSFSSTHRLGQDFPSQDDPKATMLGKYLPRCSSMNSSSRYVEVDEDNGTELFYYFVESEASTEDAPFLLWLSGGDRCSVLSGLALEIGPFQFVPEPYNGTVPRLKINPYSWTKVANILFVDTPVGAGFSFSRRPQGYHVGEVSTSLQLHELLIKWFTDHHEFLANPLYIGGDSLAGQLVPFIAQKISEGIEAGRSPILNLKGYLVGNPATGEIIDESSKVSYAHGVGIIPDQLYETILEHCQGEDYRKPTNTPCAQALGTFNNLRSEVMTAQILLDNCYLASAGPGTKTAKSAAASRKILSEEAVIVTGRRVKHPPPRVPLGCYSYTAYLSYFWANDALTRDALGVKDGTVDEWVRCHNGDLPYAVDIGSSIKYHRNVTTNGYRALVYSGDHDAIVPHLGTQASSTNGGLGISTASLPDSP